MQQNRPITAAPAGMIAVASRIPMMVAAIPERIPPTSDPQAEPIEKKPSFRATGEISSFFSLDNPKNALEYKCIPLADAIPARMVNKVAHPMQQNRPITAAPAGMIAVASRTLMTVAAIPERIIPARDP